MHHGYVARVNEERGFGFIAMADPPDLFFHCSELQGGLIFDAQLKMRRVEFEIVDSPKGPRAANVRPAE